MRKEITHQYVIKDYSNIKSRIVNAIDKKSYIEALTLIETAAKIAYHLNFRFSDDELEGYLQNISNCTLPKYEFEPVKKERFIFYDYFGLDNKGLTQQYLFALKKWDVDFLYILETRENEKYASEILEELSQISRAEVYVVPTYTSATIAQEKALYPCIKLRNYLCYSSTPHHQNELASSTLSGI